MNRTLNTTFLDDEDRAAVRAILQRHGLEDFGAEVRLWGRGKAVDVNGTLGLDELRCLIEVARYLRAPTPHVQNAPADGAPASRPCVAPLHPAALAA